MDERLDTGSFTLRNLGQHIPLSDDLGDSAIRVTCVEVWNGNLYIGTSTGEIIHYVALSEKDSIQPLTFQLASRQTPPVNGPDVLGIQQILLLPAVEKACVISSSTLSFYTLPELSPANPSRAKKPPTCSWIGGQDIDADANGYEVMMCLKNRLRLIEVANDPTRKKDIEFGGCLSIVRRGRFACVADSKEYALLDVENQTKIPLFSISSVEDPSDAIISSDLLPYTPNNNLDSLQVSEDRGHRKSSSLNVIRTEAEESPRSVTPQQYENPDLRRSAIRRVSTTDISSNQSSPIPQTFLNNKPLPQPPTNIDGQLVAPLVRPVSHSLKPLIASPSPDVFLLVTGAAPQEPGVGIFVNLVGEIDRGTISFATYPQAIAVDGRVLNDTSSITADGLSDECYVLALVQRIDANKLRSDIEIQRSNSDQGEVVRKEWLDLPPSWSDLDLNSINLHSNIANETVNMPEIAEKLTLKPVQYFTLWNKDFKNVPNPERLVIEAGIFKRHCKFDAHITVWYRHQIYWILRNPLLLKFESRLQLAQSPSIAPESPIIPDRKSVETIYYEIQSLQETSELDYPSFGYIRQKAALLLFFDLVLLTLKGELASQEAKYYTHKALIESKLDPRLVIALLPNVREIYQAEDGIWVQAGIGDLFELFAFQNKVASLTFVKEPYVKNLLQVARQFLLHWREKKGYPSIIDGPHVFLSVDASLLHILLLLDASCPAGPATPGSARSDLYTVVDNKFDCYDRAEVLLEKYNRLYVLSRLHHKRKSPALVLSTWRRILETNNDPKGEFLDGDNEVARYLSKLKDKNLVITYGTWLSKRNSKVGIKVFADGTNKFWKISPLEALSLFRESAPNAVKDYLEYLVFEKQQSQHVNELLAYYLDIVLDELRNSPKSRSILIATYQNYRALLPPKPTYTQFVEHNTVDADWWHSRIRLLKLLEENRGPAASYNVPQILNKLQPFVDELVPEMIILNARQGRHEDAIQLLVHGLGDYDTAIRYCLLGGSSIFGPSSGYLPEDLKPSMDQQATLFDVLLVEFLAIEDLDQRMERTGELLERFSHWFDVAHVLSLLPEDWPVDVFAEFLIKTLQRLVRQEHETTIVVALSAAQNLQISEQLIERIRELGPVVIDKEDLK